MDVNENHIKWMQAAYREAVRAYDMNETPVGAVIVKDNNIIGRGCNSIEFLKDPTAHAEILSIGAACSATGYERLPDTTIYVTLEPCPMCAGAIILSRIPRLVFAAKDPKAGACGSLYNICQDLRLNHQVEIVSGIMEKESSMLLRDFFRTLRMKTT